MNKKKIVFVTGTRADFGKLKTILMKLDGNELFEVLLFVTGMHLLKKYDYTGIEIEKCGFKNIFSFINQNENDTMDHILAKTISGFSDYLKEYEPDMIVVHGDRIESFGAAVSACLNNIFVAHIEGGEVSGTVDEMMRHAITKISHFHFVSNEKSKNRLRQMGEMEDRIFVIGSAETDIMKSSNLPSLDLVKKYYDIPFESYAILIYHPVTTEYHQIKVQIKDLLYVIHNESEMNYIVIHPNNDYGSDLILEEYKRLSAFESFRVLTSMRFEYFLSLLKSAEFIIGNSSCGVREAPFFGVPSINIGSRQNNRNSVPTIINCQNFKADISKSLVNVKKKRKIKTTEFGDGNCAIKFEKIISNSKIWNTSPQKYFVDFKK